MRNNIQIKKNCIVFLCSFLWLSIDLLAQDKWSQNILKLDSLKKTDPEYAALLVDICWQISDLSPDTAYYYGYQALELYEKTRFDSIKYRALLGLSAAKSRQGQHAEAIELSVEALKLAETKKDTTGIFDATNNIGIDMYYQEDFESSLEYFHKSARIISNYNIKSLKSRHQYANALMNVALVESELGNSQNEIDTYYKVLKIFSDMNDIRSVGLVQFNLGKSYQSMNLNDSAIFYYQASIKNFDESKWTSAMSDVLTNWGSLLFTQKKYEEAIIKTKKGLSLSIDTKNKLQEKLAYNLIHQIFEAVGKHDSAYYYYKKYHERENESRELEKQEYADELLAKYETDKKEQQIAQLKQDGLIKELEASRQRQLKTFSFVGVGLLFVALSLLFFRYRDKNKSNALLDTKNQELAKLNNTKDRLFSIISHDLRSPLSSFHTITKSLFDNWDNLEKDQLKDFIISLRDSSSDVKNMMDNLLKWALSQSQQLNCKPMKIATGEVLESVIKDLSTITSLRSTPININSKSTAKIEADRDFLQIIIRNLLSNALKFSEMESTIDILVEESEGNQIISIQDYGVGMDQQEVDQLFAGEIVAHDIKNSTEKGTGLGLVLCHELMTKMEARMEVMSEKGKGTIFKLVFPKAA
ncbi:MAG: tetratricopeptide repeat-containing sensor histidine kinase [Reichenbachiella sp.]